MQSHSNTAWYPTSESAFLVDVSPTWPDEDGTKGGKEQASVPLMRPDDDPVVGGSRQAVCPEDPAAGGEQPSPLIDPSLAEQALVYLEDCRSMIVWKAIDRGLDPDDTFQDCFLYLATHLLPLLEDQPIKNVGGWVRNALRLQIAMRRVGAIQHRNFEWTSSHGPQEVSLDVPLSGEGLTWADLLSEPTPDLIAEQRRQRREQALYAGLRRLPLRWQQELRERWLLRGFIPHTNKRSRWSRRGEQTKRKREEVRKRAYRDLRRDQVLAAAVEVQG